MIDKCKNCGAEVKFSPTDKGLKCDSCGSVFPIKYDYKFTKKSFEENIDLPVDTLAQSLKSVKCSSCGATIMINKFQAQAECPYCGSSTIIEGRKNKLMYIDSVIPFNITKADAIKNFKSKLIKNIYADKKPFRNLEDKNVIGTYINAFVFDMLADVQYSGSLVYTEHVTVDGKTELKNSIKYVHGNYRKQIKDLTVEADGNLEQRELLSVFPFDYKSAVMFRNEFLKGFVLEYKDKMFKDCVTMAENIVKNIVQTEIVNKYNCNRAENLSIDINYPIRNYNYCLIPVYIISKQYKDKHYRVLINGQTGKVGRMPKDKVRLIFTILLISLVSVGLLFLIISLFMH